MILTSDWKILVYIFFDYLYILECKINTEQEIIYVMDIYVKYVSDREKLLLIAS